MTPPHTSNTSLHNGALAETAPDPIITIDEVSTVLYVNSAAERAFGYMASELIGQPLSMLIPERLRERHAAGMARYIATGRRSIPWQGLRVPIRTKSGIEIPVDISFGEFEWNGQRVFSGFLRDISERVASENEIATANELLQQQATELEQQIEEAQALMGELAQANHHSEVRAHLAARRDSRQCCYTARLSSSRSLPMRCLWDTQANPE
jgi:PAS domain S-box-containing protein